MYEHVPQPLSVPSSFVISSPSTYNQSLPWSISVSTVSPVQAAPGRPHVPAESTPPGGIVIHVQLSLAA